MNKCLLLLLKAGMDIFFFPLKAHLSTNEATSPGMSSLYITCYSSLSAPLSSPSGLNDNIHFDFDL